MENHDRTKMPTLELGGHQLYYEWHGDFDPKRETIVFLHDGLGSIGSWKDIPEKIAKPLGFNALVYDRFGYGRSEPRKNFTPQFLEAEVPQLNALLDALNIGNVHLVGHSDGASIALAFAGLFPGRVLSVVAEAPHTFVEELTLDGIRELKKLQDAGNSPNWLKHLHGKKSENLLKAWCEIWLSDAHNVWNIEIYLGYIDCPILVIQGENDEFGTEAQVTAILNRVVGAERIIVEECGHTPHSQYPQFFIKEVKAFYKKGDNRRKLGSVDPT